MSVVGLDDLHAAEKRCWQKARRLPQEERYELFMNCMRRFLEKTRNQSAADVVERVYRQVRQRGARAPYCLPPASEILRAVVEYVVNRVAHTRGELVTLSMRLIKRYLTKRHFALRCIVTWLGVEDCIYERKSGKVILHAKCVKEKLGII